MPPPDPHEDPSHHKTLRAAVGNERVLALVFLLLGGVIVFLGLSSRRAWEGRALGAVAGVLMVGPGVLYWLAAGLLQRAKPAGAVIARRAAAAHVAVTVLCLVLGIAGAGTEFFLPAFAGVFFVPALVAFLAESGRVMRAAVAMNEPEPGFQPVIPRPVLPVEEEPATGQAADSSTGGAGS